MGVQEVFCRQGIAHQRCLVRDTFLVVEAVEPEGTLCALRLGCFWPGTERLGIGRWDGGTIASRIGAGDHAEAIGKSLDGLLSTVVGETIVEKIVPVSL